ncbi:TRAP transporter small permease [Aurantimonas sp. A2-1-M11]|uniref:TRAP transporter small permease n=1 Tax=Aurantimonas sp. A2-1-M11 TaxID=3113712 RepID=UPI002F921401
MNRILERTRSALAVIGWIEAAVIVLLLLTIVINISVQVVSRYLFDLPLIWVEELATYSFIWATFLGASLALKYRRHVNIETVVATLGPRRQALFRATHAVIILTILAVLAPSIWAAIDIEMRRSTISLPVDIPAAWFFSVPFMVAATSLSLTCIHQLAASLNEAAGGAPEAPIMAMQDEQDEAEFQAMEHALDRSPR